MWRTILTALLATCAVSAQPKPGDGAIEGRVLTLAGQPIKKATVTLTAPPVANYQIRLTANTDAEGKFQFTGLPPGIYRLSATHAGYQDHVARRAFSIGSSDHIADAEIRLPQQALISGRVLDEDGDPSPNATVWIFKQSYRNGPKHWEMMNLAVTANENGEYRVPYLTPGRYILRVQSRGQASDNRYDDADPRSKALTFYAPTYYPSSPDEQSAQPIDVATGADLRGIDIHLVKIARPASALYHVRGKVTGVPPEPNGLVSLSLNPSDGPLGVTGWAGARPPDYSFDATVRPGQYTIQANVQNGPLAYGRASVTVAGDISGVEVALIPAPEIAGSITVAESGAQVPLKGVQMRLDGPAHSFGTSDSAGKFTVPRMYPGTYSIGSIRNLPAGCYVREVKFHGQEISWDNFDVSTSGQLEIVLSAAAGQIAGTVADADGKPFPISTVTLMAADGKSRPEKAAVDDSGAFRFTNLRPGAYKLYAWEEVDDDLWPDPDFLKKYDDQATQVTVAPHETKTVQLRVILQN